MKMKVVVLILLVAVTFAEETYNTDDNFDVDALLADEPRLHQFMDCFLDKKPCSELATTFKKVIPEAIVQACRKCSDPQKHLFWQFLKGLKVSYPKEYESLRQTYHTENKYFDALEQEISKY